MPRALWTKAPFVLLRHRGVLVAVAWTAFLVAAAAAAAPLVKVGAESEALKNKLAVMTPLAAGLFVETNGSVSRGGARQLAADDTARRTAVVRLARSLPFVGAPVFTTQAPAVVAGGPFLLGDRGLEVVLMARTGAIAHVHRLAGSGAGAWIAGSVSKAAGVYPGGTLHLTQYVLRVGRAPAYALRVGAVYEQLDQDATNPYWFNFSQDILARTPDSPLPPSFVLMSRQDLYRAASAVDGQGGRGFVEDRYELPVDPQTITFTRAEQLVQRFDALRRELARGTPTARSIGCGSTAPRGRCTVSSSLESALLISRQSIDSLTPILAPLAGFAGLLALAAAVAAGIFNVRRRSGEAELLFARGESRPVFAARVAVEALLPALVGGGLGFACADELVRVFTPAGTLDGAVTLTAASAAAAATAVTVIAIAAGAAAAYGRRVPRAHATERVWRRVPWELPVLAVGVAIFVIVDNGGALVKNTESGAHPRFIVFLFPLFIAAGLTGIAARIARRGLRRLRVGRDVVFLAVRRLAAARGLVVLLTVTAATSFAALTYAETLDSSLTAGSAEKAYVSNGSDVQGLIDVTQSLPATFPFPIAKVQQAYSGARLGSADGAPVTLLSGDPMALARVIRWDWAGDPRPALRRLAHMAGNPLPVIGTTGMGGVRTMWVEGKPLSIRVIATVPAFPGMLPGQPLVVVPAAAYAEAIRRAGIVSYDVAQTYVWVKGPPVAVERALGRTNLHAYYVSSAKRILDSADVATVTRTYGFLRAIAVAAGVLAFVALLLYLQARQRSQSIANAFLKRMGMGQAAQGASLALEASALVLFATLLGAGSALLAAAPLVKRVDPLSELAPAPSLTVPWLLIAGSLAGLVVLAAIVGALTSLAAGRSNVSEALRVD